MYKLRLSHTILIVITMLVSLPSAWAQIFPMHSPPAQSQEAIDGSRLLIGGSISGTYNQYQRGIPMVFTPICNRLENGSGTGYSWGIAAEYLVTPSIGIVFHGGYGSYPGQFDRIEPIGKAEIGGRLANIVVNIDSEIIYETVDFDLMMKLRLKQLRLHDEFGITFGPSASYVLEGKMTQSQFLYMYDGDEVITTRDLTTETGNELRHVTLAEGELIENMKWQRYGLKLGLYIDYEPFKGIYLTPSVFADVHLTGFTDFNFGALDLYGLRMDLTLGL